jgi:hypothetical protein
MRKLDWERTLGKCIEMCQILHRMDEESGDLIESELGEGISGRHLTGWQVILIDHPKAEEPEAYVYDGTGKRHAFYTLEAARVWLEQMLQVKQMTSGLKDMVQGMFAMQNLPEDMEDGEVRKWEVADGTDGQDSESE